MIIQVKKTKDGIELLENGVVIAELSKPQARALSDVIIAATKD